MVSLFPWHFTSSSALEQHLGICLTFRFLLFSFNRLLQRQDLLCDKFFIIVTSFRVFHTSVSRRFLTGVSVIASLPGLFAVFWPISIMHKTGWAPFVLLFPSPPKAVPVLWWLYRAHHLQLVSPSLSYCAVFFFNPLARTRYLAFFLLSFNFTLWSAGTEKSTIRQVLFLLGLVVWSSGRD